MFGNSQAGVGISGTLGDIDPLRRSLLREPEVGLRRAPFKGVFVILPRTGLPGFGEKGSLGRKSYRLGLMA